MNLSAFTVEPLAIATFLKKVRKYDSRLQSKRRGELTAAQKDELNSYENQDCISHRLACLDQRRSSRKGKLRPWHPEIFENPSDHAPQVGDPTPIICEITPRTEQALYREGIRIQSLAGFFRLQDKRFQATGHKAQKIRVTGYLMWDDGHNGSADIGSTIQYLGTNGFHHPWRSTAWEIHPIIKIEVID